MLLLRNKKEKKFPALSEGKHVYKIRESWESDKKKKKSERKSEGESIEYVQEGRGILMQGWKRGHYVQKYFSCLQTSYLLLAAATTITTTTNTTLFPALAQSATPNLLTAPINSPSPLTNPKRQWEKSHLEKIFDRFCALTVT